MPVHMRSSITGHDPQRAATRRNRRWGAILVGMVALVTAFALTAGAGPPVVSPRTGPRPTTNAPPPRFVAPTDNLSKVANAVDIRYKSLTVIVNVKPGLVLTAPVTISVAFSGAHSNPFAPVETYRPATGHRFVFNDVEDNGRPRRLSGGIRLTEPKPGGGSRNAYYFDIPNTNFILVPLYDVRISPMTVRLIDDCDRFGASELVFEWYKPDVRQGFGTHREKHSMRAGQTITLNNFAWERATVAESEDLRMPVYRFTETDLSPGLFDKRLERSWTNLVPGKTQTIKETRKAEKASCRIEASYIMAYWLRWYNNL